MTYLSVCSGIEAASVAWHPLGWKAVGFSEIEPFPSAVLAHHWPEVRNLGDMTDHHEWTNRLHPDLIVGGTPCQAFSVAGLRRGLEDPRGNLTLVFLGLLAQLRPRWVVWENVPGVLSDKTGAFGAFLGGLGELGYGFAYRVLDAQYYGVAQRRRRVFVVGCAGDWRRAAAVLFEPESLRGDSPPRRETRKGVAGSIDERAERFGLDYEFNAHRVENPTGALLKGSPSGGGHPLPAVMDVHAFDARQSDVLQYGNIAGPMDTDGHSIAIAIPINMQVATRHNAMGRGTGFGVADDGEPSFTLQSAHSHAVATASAVRRLTPRECERLQGFPDDYTLIPYNGKPAKDGPRYKALGNSMAVPVMRWIGERINAL